MRQVSVLIDLDGILGGAVTVLLRDRYGTAAVQVLDPGTKIADAVSQMGPTVVIMSDTATVAYAELLADHPRMRILVVEQDGKAGSLWRLLPNRKPLGVLSTEVLIDEIGRAEDRGDG